RHGPSVPGLPGPAHRPRHARADVVLDARQVLPRARHRAAGAQLRLRGAHDGRVLRAAELALYLAGLRAPLSRRRGRRRKRGPFAARDTTPKHTRLVKIAGLGMPCHTTWVPPYGNILQFSPRPPAAPLSQSPALRHRESSMTDTERRPSQGTAPPPRDTADPQSRSARSASPPAADTIEIGLTVNGEAVRVAVDPRQ